MSLRRAVVGACVVIGSLWLGIRSLPAEDLPPMKLKWEKNLLHITGPHVPGGEIVVLYIEAYCRPGSTDRDWGQTTIGHTTELISRSNDGTDLKLRCRLKDGVVVDHHIRSTSDEVDFRLTAHNPTAQESLAHWAQPCMRVDKFTGRKQTTYLDKCFVFKDDKLVRMPAEPWATQARYIPGQVWAPKHVDRNDVNPRPLSDWVPSNGLIGAFSEDEKWILATSFEPYQELFQGVITCVHADFRIGGLKPQETKKIHGKIYMVPNDMDKLLTRYHKDFPEHQGRAKK